jgi:hypothetical protein
MKRTNYLILYCSVLIASLSVLCFATLSLALDPDMADCEDEDVKCCSYLCKKDNASVTGCTKPGSSKCTEGSECRVHNGIEYVTGTIDKADNQCPDDYCASQSPTPAPTENSTPSPSPAYP